MRRHLAAGEFGYLAQPCQVGAGFLDGRPHLFHLGFGRGQRGFGFGDLVVQLGKVEPGQELAFLYPVVVVDQHRFDGAGKLAAHVHLVGRLQIAGGRYRDGKIAAQHFLAEILGRGGGIAGA